MKKTLLFLFLLSLVNSLFSQTNVSECSQIIFPQVPKQRTTRNIKATPIYPEKFEAVICFNKGAANYREDALNILDSIYSIVFNKDNGRFYKITMIGYDDSEVITEKNTDLSRQRTATVFNYFSSRENTEYIVRRTPSKFKNSCSGEQDCVIKYKMPFDFKWVNLFQKPVSQKVVNGIDLTSKVYILIEDNPEECLGKFNDYYYPSQDTTVMDKISMLKMPKGALGSITHTKDTIEYDMTLVYKELLSFEEVTRNYSLIPHNRQYLISAGYIVVKSNHQPDYNNCALKDNFLADIIVRLPIEEQQEDARLKFFAKTYKPNGQWEYKAIPTTKEKDKETKIVTLVGNLTAFQLDTIYIGKKVTEEELSNYFYPAKEGEPSAFKAMGGWLKPFKLDKRGSIVLKKEMEMVLRKPVGEMVRE